MKTNRNLWMAVSVALLLAGPPIARSQTQGLVPAAINYQGRLTDTLGNPLPGGYYEIEFRVWDDAVQNGAGNLVWGRSFPLHVVTNGLFNILLTDDGGVITSPATPTNTLLTAFGGEDRYLGLTITVSNGVNVSSSEISPRQQLATAPYAIQAQTANNVAANGVTVTSLASGSVTGAKIASQTVVEGNLANGAVSTAKLQDTAVTTAKIGNSQVTSAKLNIDTELRLNNHPLFLRGGTDENHGLEWTNSFGGQSMDGPALFGYGGGVLGTTSGGEKAALVWDQNQAVTMKGTVTMSGDASMQGAVTISKGPVSMFGPYSDNNQMGTIYTASTDGFIIYFGYRAEITFNWWKVGNNTATPDISRAQFFVQAGADTKMICWPVAKGERYQLVVDNTLTNGYHVLGWRPLGTN